MANLANKQETTYQFITATMSTLIEESFSQSELNLLLHPPCILTISLDDVIGENRRINKLAPPRPQNAWIIFRKNYESQLRSQNPGYTVMQISKLASMEWKNQPCSVKNYFKTLSKLVRLQHKHDYPGYTYARGRNLGRSKNRNRGGLIVIEGKIPGYKKERRVDKQIDKRAQQADNYVCTTNDNMSFNYYPAYTLPLVDMTAWNEQPYNTADGYVNEDFTYDIYGIEAEQNACLRY